MDRTGVWYDPYLKGWFYSHCVVSEFGTITDYVYGAFKTKEAALEDRFKKYGR